MGWGGEGGGHCGCGRVSLELRGCGAVVRPFLVAAWQCGQQWRGSWAQEEEGSQTRGAGGRASAGHAQEDVMARAEKKQAPVSGC